jgi:hypothetical protein
VSGQRDIDKEVATAYSIVPSLVDTTANGTGVDLAGFTKALVLITAGVITDGTHTITLEDSDDNTTFAAVASGFRSGSFTALTSSAGGSAIQEIGYLGTKRYIRIVTTVTGSPSTGGIYSALVVKAGARTLPQ